MPNTTTLRICTLMMLVAVVACDGSHHQTQAQESGVTPCNVRDFGAVGDGQTKDHAAIQRAIDACAERGGGTVYVPRGEYLIGTIELKSNIRLYLGAGATLLGSPDRADYRLNAFGSVLNERKSHAADD